MQPREHYARDGAVDFGDVELIALILGTGTQARSVREIAATLLDRFDGLSALGLAHPAELARENGVGMAKAIRLHAGLELGRRAMRASRPETPIRTATEAWAFLAPGLCALPDEELHGLYLDRRLCPIAHRVLSRGSDTFTIVDPRQIFRPAISLGASSVVLAHNHPSGDCTPSIQDREVTRRVANAGRVLGIPLLDHLVLGTDTFASLAEQGHLPQWEPDPVWTA